VDEWKKAWFTPIYKSDDRLKCENYLDIILYTILLVKYLRDAFLIKFINFLMTIHFFQIINMVFGLNIQLSPL
jgi:hypothetical protein